MFKIGPRLEGQLGLVNIFRPAWFVLCPLLSPAFQNAFAVATNSFHIDVTFEMRTAVQSKAFIQLISQHMIRLYFISETEKGTKGQRESEGERARERERGREREGERASVGRWQM
jgi:hypothetical protein